MDEFAYVGAERRFDLINGPILHQLPCRDGDTHGPRRTNTNTHWARLKGRRDLAGPFIMSLRSLVGGIL